MKLFFILLSCFHFAKGDSGQYVIGLNKGEFFGIPIDKKAISLLASCFGENNKILIENAENILQEETLTPQNQTIVECYQKLLAIDDEEYKFQVIDKEEFNSKYVIERADYEEIETAKQTLETDLESVKSAYANHPNAKEIKKLIDNLDYITQEDEGNLQVATLREKKLSQYTSLLKVKNENLFVTIESTKDEKGNSDHAIIFLPFDVLSMKTNKQADPKKIKAKSKIPKFMRNAFNIGSSGGEEKNVTQANSATYIDDSKSDQTYDDEEEKDAEGTNVDDSRGNHVQPVNTTQAKSQDMEGNIKKSSIQSSSNYSKNAEIKPVTNVTKAGQNNPQTKKEAKKKKVWGINRALRFVTTGTTKKQNQQTE